MYVVYCENWWNNRWLRSWTWFNYTLVKKNAKFFESELEAMKAIEKVDRFLERTNQEKRIWHRVEIQELTRDEKNNWICFDRKQWYDSNWNEIPVAIMPKTVPIRLMYECHKVWKVITDWDDWIIEYWGLWYQVSNHTLEVIRLGNRVWWKFKHRTRVVYYKDLTEEQKYIFKYQ